MKHREYVGGLWDAMGSLQLEFLKRQGLLPEHRLLDLPCGSLRAGRLLIPYLASGCYVGVDRNQWLVDAGLQHELPPSVRREKAPRFILRDDFRLDQALALEAGFWYPEVVMTQSLFTHLPLPLVEKCLRRVRDVADPEGCTWFATYLPGDPKGNPAGPDDTLCHRYPRETLAELMASCGWEVAHLGEWGSPRKQLMFRLDCNGGALPR